MPKYALAEIYRSTDPPHDFSEAAKWYRKAAAAGHPKAQFSLGVMYYSGRLGVPTDYVQAYAWLSLAASVPEGQIADAAVYEVASTLVCAVHGPDECKRRGVVALLIEGLTSDMTPDQIAEAQRMARELNEAAKQQHSAEPSPDDHKRVKPKGPFDFLNSDPTSAFGNMLHIFGLGKTTAERNREREMEYRLHNFPAGEETVQSLPTLQPPPLNGDRKVYDASECIGPVIMGECKGSILPNQAYHPTCHGEWLNGQCTGPMF